MIPRALMTRVEYYMGCICGGGGGGGWRWRWSGGVFVQVKEEFGLIISL
jgi:hypothetical protein